MLCHYLGWVMGLDGIVCVLRWYDREGLAARAVWSFGGCSRVFWTGGSAVDWLMLAELDLVACCFGIC